MKVLYLVVFDIFYFASLHPIQTENKSYFIGDLKQYYDKFRRILREVIKQPIDSSKIGHMFRRWEIPPGMTNEDIKKELEKHGVVLPPNALKKLQKTQREAKYFENLAGAPYWPGSEDLYDRTVEPRYISPTVKQDYTESTTLNPDCNQDCLEIFEKRGHLCAQRMREMRKELGYNNLYGVLNYLLIGRLFELNPYSYTEDDDHNYWEYRDFDNICDMEYENCRNKTHSAGWFPAYFGECEDPSKNPRQYAGIFRTARHAYTRRHEAIAAKQTLDFYESTTGIWMLY